MNFLRVYVDGSGREGYYCYVTEDKKIRVFKEKSLTNNQAEYKAIITALKEIPEINLIIYSDSQLAVRQLNGLYQIRDPKLKILASEVRRLCSDRCVHFEWIPRNQNLAGKALDKMFRSKITLQQHPHLIKAPNKTSQTPQTI
ncbi:MAG: ribonuclease HI family protein [Candidatus Bathyarchaeia archaeon]